MARNLEVKIIGDASSLERALGKAQSSSSRLGGAFQKVGQVAKYAGVAIGAGVVVGLEKSVHAAIEAQQSQARLEQAFKVAGLSAQASAGQIDKAEASARKLGFTDAETHLALGSLVTATGSVTKSMSELSVAQDLARFKGIGLVDATKMLTMAQTGSQRAAKQLGISVSPLTANVDALSKSATSAEKAHAKLLDKMATGNAVIAAVSAKVQGQGAAFAGTAAGGMAAFHAQLDSLEVKIGTALLPTLQKVMTALSGLVDWLSTSPAVAHAASVAFTVFKDVMSVLVEVGQKLLGFYQQHRVAALAVIGVLAALAVALASPIAVIVAVGVALIELYKRSETFRNIVNAAFQAVHDKVLAIMPTIKAIIEGVVTAAEAIWARFGRTIISVARTALQTVERVFRDLGGVISGVVALIGDIIHGRWGKIWGDLSKIVGSAFDALKALIVGEARIIWTEALAIGQAIIDGVIAGLGNIVGRVGGALHSGLKGAVHFAGGLLSGSGEFMWTKQAIGHPMAEGVVEGWLEGTATLSSKISQKLRDAIDAGRQLIDSKRAVFATAFGRLASRVFSAFDAETSQHQTPAEKLLAGIADRRQMEDLQKALADAITGGDPQAILRAREDIQMVSLQKQADAERQNYQARRDNLRQSLEDRLAALQTHFTREGATVGELTKGITTLLRSYGLNFAEVGDLLGNAFLAGLKGAIGKAGAGASAIEKTIGVVASRISVGKAIPMAAGGVGHASGPMLFSTRGNEDYAFSGEGRSFGSAGGGGGGVTFAAGAIVVNGFVGNEQQLANQIVSLLQRRAASMPAGTPFRTY